MEHHELTVGEAFFKEMERKRTNSPGEVVMVIRRPGGKVLLTTKDFYPAGIYRLPSGQMTGDETPEEALIRETFEETGFHVQIDRHLGTIGYTFKTDSKTIEYVSHVFLTEETVGEPASQDADEEITGYRDVDPSELENIAQNLQKIAGIWNDWGRFRAISHDFVYEILASERNG